jgi:hypothetical protein
MGGRMNVRRDFPCVALVAAPLFALLPGAAAAAPTWLSPETLDGTGSEAGSPDVTAFGDGQAAMVWTRFLASDETAHVFASVRPRGGPWGPAEDLDARAEPSDVRIVARPDGELIAVWRGTDAFADYDAHWARHPPGGPWSQPADVPIPSCCEVLEDLVVGSDGSVTVLWDSTDASPTSSTMPGGSDEWGPAEPLPDIANPSLAAAPDGSVAVAWAANCSASGDCVQAAYKAPGERWSAPELVGDAQDTVTGVALVARADSSFTAAWTQSGPPGAVRSNDRTPGAGGGWAAVPDHVADLLTDQAGCRFGATGCIDLAVGADGKLAAVWSQGPASIILRSLAAPSGPAVAASVRSPGGGWGEAELAGAPGGGDAFPQAAVTATGPVVATWVAGNVMRVSRRAADGTWTAADRGAPVVGEDSIGHQDVVADAEGNAVTAWRDPDGMEAAAFDAAGPRITAFSAPTAGSIGQALAFSAAANDSWSPPAAITWSFGDSTGAAGGSVSHAYTGGGAFTATATAADAIGNTTARSGGVSVPAPTCGNADKDNDGIGDSCDDNDGSTNPVPFKTVTVRVISGEVFIKLPAGAARAAQAAPKGFTRLQGAATVPVGSTLDTSRGRIQLRSAADTRKKVQKGDFFDGRFVIRQIRKPRGKARRRPIGLITELRLNGSSFSRCGAQASARSKRKVRRLWGDGKGSFRTTGRHAAATVRGTRWLVEDRCDGTLVRVRRGRVEVRDLERKRNVLVRAGHNYLARVR